MRFRRVIVSLILASVAGCQGDSGGITPPTVSFAIADGARGGNPDFFFLPPMVANPQSNPAWTAGAFNPNLQPVVMVCALAATTEGAVTPSTPCRTPQPSGFPRTFTMGAGAGFLSLNGEMYQVDWKTDPGEELFRITVKVGSKTLGFADLHTLLSGKDKKNVNQDNFVPLEGGANLPIKFRIENGALCNPPGTTPCSSRTFNLVNGSEVSLKTGPGGDRSGLFVPPQSVNSVVTVTVQPCPDFNPRLVDLPTFGSCLDISSDPALGQAFNPGALVFVCDVGPDLVGLTHAQERNVSLHRFDGTDTYALPHAQACAITHALARPSLSQVARDLAHGRLKSAGRAVLGLLAPEPLAATGRRLDRGGGGISFGLSQFQFALPAKLQIQAGNGQNGPAGNPLPIQPTVLVTDLDGTPVENATVRFAAIAGGSVSASMVLTGANGLAGVTWTLPGALGTRQMVAYGKGLAAPNRDGPRVMFDPFMAIQPEFNPGNDPVPSPLQQVLLRTGEVIFSATAH